MGFRKLWWWLSDILRVQYARYRTIFWWLIFCLGLGLILGIVSIVIGDLGTDDLNTSLIDANLRGMAGVSTSFGHFIWQRLLSIWLPTAFFLLGAGLSKVTASIVFPYFCLHGYWLGLTVWWTWLYYTINAVFLLIFYCGWLLLITAVLMAGALWALNWGTAVRATPCHPLKKQGGRLWQGLLVLTAVALICGTIEFLVYTTVLGKIVYKPL